MDTKKRMSDFNFLCRQRFNVRENKENELLNKADVRGTRN